LAEHFRVPGLFIRGFGLFLGSEDTGRYETVYNVHVGGRHAYFIGSADWEFVVWAQKALCDPSEVAHIHQELARNQNNLGMGVIDNRTGEVRLFTYDETDAFSRANPHLQVMAGHEAAAAMAGVLADQARGFVLGQQGSDWQIFNQSHLNQADGQPNPLRMDPRLFNVLVSALQRAGVQNPLIH
jgi:hypothetical protein